MSNLGIVCERGQCALAAESSDTICGRCVENNVASTGVLDQFQFQIITAEMAPVIRAAILGIGFPCPSRFGRLDVAVEISSDNSTCWYGYRGHTND